MKKCPTCNNYTIEYDAYRGVYRCMMVGCSCIVIDDDTYSFLKIDPSAKTINRVKVVNGAETKVIKKYNLY